MQIQNCFLTSSKQGKSEKMYVSYYSYLIKTFFFRLKIEN